MSFTVGHYGDTWKARYFFEVALGLKTLLQFQPRHDVQRWCCRMHSIPDATVILSFHTR